MKRIVFHLMMAAGLTYSAVAETPEPHVPNTVSAGSPFAISTNGQGRATLYLLGPSHAVKRTIELGREQQVSGADIDASGLYQVVVCNGDGCGNTSLQVLPAAPARVNFFLHPSRVPVSTSGAIGATAIVFDRYKNLVLDPAKVDFRLTLPDGPSSTRSVQTVRGIAWFGLDSRPKQGKLQVVASVDGTSEPRVIQQVASEACGLRMTATPSGNSVILQTDPVRDCTGNALPDGTIVSFTKIDGAGTSTVDTPIKKDRAVAKFQVSGPSRISVACGAVVGNEISTGGTR